MALKSAVKTGGDFLDLKELAADGPVLAVFRIREFQMPEKGEFGYLLPVVADVFIVDGDQAGELHPNEKQIGAITSALRGVRNPNAAKGEQPQAPVNEVGDEIAVRIALKNAGKNNAFVVGDEPSKTEMAAIEKAYEAAGGALLWNKEPAMAGAAAPSGEARPW
jgi:hypothetical protein